MIGCLYGSRHPLAPLLDGDTYLWLALGNSTVCF
jgi:hypothetical protein